VVSREQRGRANGPIAALNIEGWEVAMGFLGDLFGTRGAIYVSPPPPGWDKQEHPGTGTQDDPYHSVATAIEAARGGKSVWLQAGQYVEEVKLDRVRGALLNKIVVQPYGGATVTIDCLETRFLNPTDQANWIPFAGGAPHEYVWSEKFPVAEAQQVRRGAFLTTPFLAQPQHTRLVIYDQAGDFRAANELWPKDLTTGDNNVWERKPDPDHPGTQKWTHTGIRNWVYMGPGLWFDDKERELHIRLSPTNNNITDWPDYDGPTDPTELELALSKETSHALLLTNCAHIMFKNLTIRFGGQDTIRLRNCADITFDHVNIRAASRAVRLEGGTDEKNERIRLRHCEIDGGMPTWFFRSDRKDAYRFTPHVRGLNPQPEPQGDPPENLLGFSTTAVLVSARYNASNVSIDHCKIFNGHDVYVFGDHMRFHHNWVHNINDDAVNFGADEAGTDDAWVYRNVITQCLTALSFGAAARVGHVRIFRNLIDLREPTLSIRPPTAPANPFRTGQLYKQNGPGEGPIDLWHNTCVVLNPGANSTELELDDFNAAGFTHYRILRDHTHTDPLWVTDPRRALNNIFVAVYPVVDMVKPIAFLPPSSFQGLSDGNIYARVDTGSTEPRYAVTDHGTSARDYHDLEGEAGYKAAFPPHEHSGCQIEPPPFVSFAADGLPRAGDDLRHRQGTPQAITMPADIEQVERKAGGILALLFGRVRGCYWLSSDRMSVGVDGKERFPS
jgi:hypothetical protein